MREVEPAGEGLSTNENIDFPVFDDIVEAGKVVVFIVITVKTSDFSFGKELFEFGFEKLGAKTFMDDAGMMTIRATRGDFLLVATDVTTEHVGIGVEDHGEEAVRAEGLPAAFFADGKRGGAAAIVKN